MTYTHAKDQGQRLVGSKDKVETYGRMDEGNFITFRANAVSKIMAVINDIISQEISFEQIFVFCCPIFVYCNCSLGIWYGILRGITFIGIISNVSTCAL